MTDKELAIKYTDTVYATKADVINGLHTSLIDPFWAKIVEYRNQYKRVLSLLAITKTPYYITMTNPVKDSLVSIQNKLSKLAVSISHIEDNAPEKITICNEMYARILKIIAVSNGLTPSDVTIANIISERSVSEEYDVLVNYFASLKYLEKHFIVPVSEDTLGEYLTVIEGVEELTAFYRTSEISSHNQKVMVGRQYTSAPVSLIEYLMTNTIDFVNNSTLDYIVKAFAAYYSLNSIKPFDAHNEELSIIILKKVLAPQSVESLVSIIPFEELLLDGDGRLSKAFLEAGRTRDLTYLLIEFIKKLDRSISVFTNRLEQIQLTTISKEYKQGASEEEFAKEIGVTYVKEEPVKPVYVQSTPVKKPVKKVETSYEPVKVVHAAPTQSVASKDYDALAEDLLESDPLLRPAQAAFYVRHCTVGKFYTIAQYKKATGCVYETARTSMDNLAKRGYYKREGLKNKFIYTPIPKE